LRLRWSVTAFTDRESIFDYIVSESPRAAVAIDERIQLAAEGLKDFPMSGRLGRIEGTRELLVVQTPYIVAYRLAEDLISILCVLHGAQRWPGEF
jgi:toxin ParE1/3/4